MVDTSLDDKTLSLLVGGSERRRSRCESEGKQSSICVDGVRKVREIGRGSVSQKLELNAVWEGIVGERKRHFRK